LTCEINIVVSAFSFIKSGLVWCTVSAPTLDGGKNVEIRFEDPIVKKILPMRLRVAGVS